MPHLRVSAAGMRIMRLLIGHPPRSMNDLIEATGVTRTAICGQISELIEKGLVQQTQERLSTRGRPRYVYTATDFAQKRLFEGNQNEVFLGIWRGLSQFCSPQIREKILLEAAQTVAAPFNKQILAEDPLDRMREFFKIINATGRLAKIVDKGDSVSVSKLSCPFISMYEENATICAVDCLTMTEIIKCPVERTAYRHDKDSSCCTFHVARGNH